MDREMDSERRHSELQPTLTGMGGGLRYSSESATLRMVNQEHNYSCVIACVRQLLRDSGLALSETELRDQIGLADGHGSDFEQATIVLSALHPQLVYGEGCLEDLNQLETLFQRDPWIARVRTLSGRYHTVIVDGSHDKLVSVRDPWGLRGPGSGCGTEATLQLEHFLEHWHFGLHAMIYPKQRKGKDKQ